jgi:hypothetical protein
VRFVLVDDHVVLDAHDLADLGLDMTPFLAAISTTLPTASDSLRTAARKRRS